MRTYLSAARTGGQGKTTVAQLVHLMHEAGGIKINVAGADSDSVETKSKIGRFLKDVRELGIGADLKSIKASNDPNTAIKYWDEFGRLLLTGGYVIDVGANVARNLFDWAEVRNAGSLLKKRTAPPIDLIVTIKAETQALEDARDLMELSFAKEEFLMFERRYVVLNEVAGSFANLPVERTFKRLAMQANKQITLISLPKCTSDLWPLMEREFLSIRDTLRLSESDLDKRYGIDVWEANAGLSDLRIWVNHALTNFQAAGLVARSINAPED